MTLENAQDKAVEALSAAFASSRPKVYVQSYDGVLSFEEGRQRFKNTPVLLVSPLTCDDLQVQLAVYMLAVSTDEHIVSVIDTTVSVLRGLSGTGRIPLSVSTRSLYDKDAAKTGLRIWVHMVTWPHLADGSAAVSADSPVCAAKSRIAGLFPDGTMIAGTEAEAKRMLLGSSLPFVTILAEGGTFDASDRRTVSQVDGGSRKRQTAKGAAVWMIEVKAYASSESSAEALLWQVVPYLPHGVQDGMGWNTIMTVERLEEGKTEGGAAVASVITRLEVPALQAAVAIPSIRNANVLARRIDG